MVRTFTLLLLVFLIINSVFAQDEKKSPKTKSGWSFGAVPAIAFDSDIGFKYGGLVNFYDYGDGTIYPKYNHSVYFEWSRTTKGSGINQFKYDSEHLIPGVRVNGEASLLTEKALDFYGFNGYEGFYNPDFEDTASASYISRMYYRYDRSLIRLKAEFQGGIIEKKLRWLGGMVFYGNTISTVDIDNLNKGKDPEDLLPDTALLYDKYVQWGVIPADQAKGGNNLFLKAGLIYDTRDNEPNPMKGLWEEAFFMSAPGFLGNDYAFTKLILTHRQYFTLIDDQLSFAYRLSYQGKIFGDMPFYMMPFVYDTQIARDGLGGAKTIRGVLRNRIIGESVAFGTAEFRWKFLRTVLWNQNIYLALSTFADAGTVLKGYKYDLTNVPAGEIIKADDEGLHISYGAGFRVALNENFVVAIDYGMVADKRDGKSGLYIGLNWLF